MRTDLSGIDIVPDVVRLCAMNLYLHGAATIESPIERADALNSLGSVRYDMVLTNPPFGRKQGYKIVGDDGEIESEREEYNVQISSRRPATSNSTFFNTSCRC
jgi:type I restriction enzyme M protein